MLTRDRPWPSGCEDLEGHGQTLSFRALHFQFYQKRRMQQSLLLAVDVERVVDVVHVDNAMQQLTYPQVLKFDIIIR